MKKFTINCDFGGMMSPFDIYIGEPKEDHHPLHFQADWLSKTRGGVVPSEVMEAITKLQDLAKKNGVALEELCVYALGSAQQEEDGEAGDDGDDGDDTDEEYEDESEDLGVDEESDLAEADADIEMPEQESLTPEQPVQEEEVAEDSALTDSSAEAETPTEETQEPGVEPEMNAEFDDHSAQESDASLQQEPGVAPASLEAAVDQMAGPDADTSVESEESSQLSEETAENITPEPEAPIQQTEASVDPSEEAGQLSNRSQPGEAAQSEEEVNPELPTEPKDLAEDTSVESEESPIQTEAAPGAPEVAPELQAQDSKPEQKVEQEQNTPEDDKNK